jgi:mannosyltransferase
LVLLGTILITAVALDVFHLGARSLWLDEATSIAFARLDWQTLLRILSRAEANMSLYYGLLHVWMRLGESEFTIRLLSVLMALAAVGAIYLLGERMYSPQVGLVSALLLAVNAYHVTYAQQARSYSLLVLLVTISSLAFIQAIERPTWKRWAIYIITGVLAVYAHFFGFLVLLAHGTSLAFSDRRRLSWKHVFVSAAIIGLCLSPLAVFALTRDTGQLSWIAKPTRQDILQLVYDLTGAGPTGAKPLVVVYGLACAIAIWAAIKPRVRRCWFLLTWFGLPIALTLAVSVVKPLFVPYYMIVCLPPLVLLAASGLSTLPRGHSPWR